MQIQVVNMTPIHGIQQRLSLRKKLNVSASEMEVLELIGTHEGMSLQRMANELGMAKSGVDKIVLRLIEKGVLSKTLGKPIFSEHSKIVLQSGTKTEVVPQSSTNDEAIESGVNDKIVQQSSTNDKNILQSGTNNDQSEDALTDFVLQSGTNMNKAASHVYAHGGRSNNINSEIILKEEKKIKEKINPLPPDKKEKQKKEESKKLNFPFNLWWDAYDKKVGNKAKLERHWARLSNKEREAAMIHTPLYVKSTPDRQFRKNPQTYLNQEHWNSEIIESNGRVAANKQTSYGIGRTSSTVHGTEHLIIRVDQLGDIEL